MTTLRLEQRDDGFEAAFAALFTRLAAL